MKNDKYIIYAGDGLGIQDTAMQVHAINLSKIFCRLGYAVVFISFNGWIPGMDEEIFYSSAGESFHCYYTISNPMPNDTYRRWYRRFHSLVGKKHYRNIVSLIEKYKPDFVIYYGYISVKYLVSYSSKKNIPLIMDHTDWFSSDHFFDFYNRYVWSRHMDRCIRKWSAHASGSIAISEFFYDYYKDTHPTIKIPALCDSYLNKKRNNKKKEGLLKLVYAGTPGNKDLLKPLIDAVQYINNDEILVTFDIIGINDFRGENQGLDSKGIIFHGKVNHEIALELVSKSDCSVLLRRNEKYAKAGFSTKFAESMMMGVPVICTAIGGTDRCIVDGQNGFLVNDNKVETIIQKLKTIMEIAPDEYGIIKESTLEYAKEHFDYESYVNSMGEFLDEILKLHNMKK